MEIFRIGGNYFCQIKYGFAFQQLEIWLDDRMGLRRDSFAAKYTKHIFRDLFLYARDLRQEYKEYYSQEYDSLEKFLYHKEMWECDDVHALKLTPDQTILELQPHLASYNAETLLDYEGSGMEAINNVLRGMPF